MRNQKTKLFAIFLCCLATGGGEMHSASYAMQSTVGQTAIGTASDGCLLEAGYWYSITGGGSGICGDLNDDGEVTAADAVIALEIATGGRPCDVATLAAADIDRDGQVTALDALMILQAAGAGMAL
jgi:hypothetical protein